MRLLFSALLFLAINCPVQTQKLSLEAALKTGLANRLELKTQNLLTQIAQGENKKIRAQWLPQVSGSADLRWNTQLQTTVLPFDISGQNPGGQSEVKFGLPFNNALSIQAEQKIWNADKRIDRLRNDAKAESEAVTLERLQTELRQSITEAYYQAVFDQERVVFAQQKKARFQSELETAEVRFRSGTLLENDLNRARLDVGNAALGLQKAEQDLIQSLENLRYQMNTSEPVTSLADDLESMLTAAQNTSTMATPELRPEIKSEAIALKINLLEEKKQRAQNRPSIAAYANYSLFQLSETPNPFAAGTWFPFNYLGVRATIPIFDGKLARLNAADYQIRQQINRYNLERYKADVEYETKTALIQLEQTRADLAELRKNVSLAQQILATDRLRAEKGALITAALVNTEYALREAENNYLAGVRDFLLAHLRFRKAAGIL